MRYNITPFTNLINSHASHGNVWRDRIKTFFSCEEFDVELQDMYYERLLQDITEVGRAIFADPIVDQYTGLFSLSSPHIEATHSFNVAKFISDNYQHFYGKKILTVCADFGILNIQAKLCGLNIISSVQKPFFVAGSMMTCIGNSSPPYPINKFDFLDEDIMILSCVFQDDDLTYKNWQMMLDKRSEGKEIFFTSNSYFFLRRYMNYDKIELVFDPRLVYNGEDYADITYGYMNRIYRIK